MIEVLNAKLETIALCTSGEAATAAARLTGAAWVRTEGSAWQAALRVDDGEQLRALVVEQRAEIARLRAELEAVARVRP